MNSELIPVFIQSNEVIAKPGTQAEFCCKEVKKGAAIDDKMWVIETHTEAPEMDSTRRSRTAATLECNPGRMTPELKTTTGNTVTPNPLSFLQNSKSERS
ncbi:MAG: hypothetical protein Q8N74_02490 [Sulfuricella sp.]|nr:hypothetical protein [Sulfuricella sp.]